MNARKWGALLPTFFAISACDTSTNVAGTNNETHSKGTFYQANGKVAAGARVRVFAANQNPNDTLPVSQTVVDPNGQVSLHLKRGYYSLLADDTSHRAIFLDSLFSDGDTVLIPTDTLRPTGTLTGHIRVQPMHSPSIAWTHLMRTNLFANVDSTGFFKLSGVPAGRMELVAASLLPEYTPTFREIRAYSDSTLDIGTIDLVYNGLPLVTGIVASYDSLSGVVTVKWRDTAYARKAGYVIYRQDGPATWLQPPQRGYSESANFNDTVFGGFGSTPSRYDSTEMDLTYWVGASATGHAPPGPLWNKVMLHAKSPALAKRWNVAWNSFIPLTNSGGTLDTLKSGVALASNEWDFIENNSKSVLRIAHPDGTVSRHILSIRNDTDAAPVFCNGKIWIARGILSGDTLIDSLPGFAAGSFFDSTRLFLPVFDTIHLLSSEDGIHWDSISIPTQSKQTTAIQLKVVLNELRLLPSSRWFNRYTSMKGVSAISEMRYSFEGIKVSPEIDTLGLGWGTDFNFNPPKWGASFASVDAQHTWTCYSLWNIPNPTRTFLIPGESSDTTKSVLTVTDALDIRLTSKLLVLSVPYSLNLASPESPTVWQRLSYPEQYLSGYCFWRGQLVVLGPQGLHFATITPNP